MKRLSLLLGFFVVFSVIVSSVGCQWFFGSGYVWLQEDYYVKWNSGVTCEYLGYDSTRWYWYDVSTAGGVEQSYFWVVGDANVTVIRLWEDNVTEFSCVGNVTFYSLVNASYILDDGVNSTGWIFSLPNITITGTGNITVVYPVSGGSNGDDDGGVDLGEWLDLFEIFIYGDLWFIGGLLIFCVTCIMASKIKFTGLVLWLVPLYIIMQYSSQVVGSDSSMFGLILYTINVIVCFVLGIIGVGKND